MPTFYLQQWEENGRQIIDSTFPQSAHKVFRSVEVDCWIAAKKAFGYALTPAQEYLLAEFRKAKKEAA